MVSEADRKRLREHVQDGLRATLRPLGRAALDALLQPDVEAQIEALVQAAATIDDMGKRFDGTAEAALAFEAALRDYRAALAAVSERAGAIALTCTCMGTGPAH